MLPLSLTNSFAVFKLSVLTSLLNKFSACLFERIFVASLTPAITSALSEILIFAALILTSFLARTIPSICTVPVPGALNFDSQSFIKEGLDKSLLYFS